MYTFSPKRSTWNETYLIVRRSHRLEVSTLRFPFPPFHWVALNTCNLGDSGPERTLQRVLRFSVAFAPTTSPIVRSTILSDHRKCPPRAAKAISDSSDLSRGGPPPPARLIATELRVSSASAAQASAAQIPAQEVLQRASMATQKCSSSRK